MREHYSSYYESTAPGVTNWLSFNEETAGIYIGGGSWVLVNFTAKWCLNCRINEGVLLSEEGAKLYREYGVKAMVADWTRKSDFITESIMAVGRAGIPLTVLYPPSGEVGEVYIFPEFFTIKDLREAFKEKIGGSF